MDSQPFRFLELPTELRLMVYEHLEIETRLHTIEDLYPSQFLSVREDRPPEITIEIKSVSGWGILATCRAVFAEAHPIMASKLQHIRYFEPTRLILDVLSFQDLFNGPLHYALSPDTYQYVEDHGCYKYGELSIDREARKTFDFVRQCGNYMRWNKSRQSIVTIKPHPHDSYLDVSIWGETLREFMQHKLGIQDVQVEFYNFDQEAIDEVLDDLWDTKCWILTEAGWHKLWAYEEVIGFA
jgi:hypothetical protein